MPQVPILGPGTLLRSRRRRQLRRSACPQLRSRRGVTTPVLFVIGTRRTAPASRPTACTATASLRNTWSPMPGTSKEIQGVIQWDGKGNYTQNADVTLAGKTGSGSDTGTYTVDSNGRFSCQYKGFVAALRQGLPQPPARLPGRPEKSGSAPGLRRLATAIPPTRLGGLSQASLRW